MLPTTSYECSVEQSTGSPTSFLFTRAKHVPGSCTLDWSWSAALPVVGSRRLPDGVTRWRPQRSFRSPLCHWSALGFSAPTVYLPYGSSFPPRYLVPTAVHFSVTTCCQPSAFGGGALAG